MFKRLAVTAALIAACVAVPTETDAATYFGMLPVNASLPSEAWCASEVKPVAEIHPSNATYNQRTGVGGNYTYPGVTGNFTGTTDEIIQWAACKWGMDEDVLRAQAVAESSWLQNNYGDFSTSGSSCSPLLPIANYPPQYPGDAAHNNQCPESVGMMQVRWLYHKSAFYSSPTENSSTLTNNAILSTAYNLDYYAAIWRNCYNGVYTWLNTVERGATYSAGDSWGCLGMWYSGRWRTQPALNYISAVQSHLANRTWEAAEFAIRTSPNPIIGGTPTTTTTTTTTTPSTTTTTVPSSTTTTTSTTTTSTTSTTTTAPADTVGPVITFIAPYANATVKNAVAVRLKVTDNVKVASVSIYVDETYVASDSSAPYTFSWNSKTIANGWHSIAAVAYDTSGNVGIKYILVRVANGRR